MSVNFLVNQETQVKPAFVREKRADMGARFCAFLIKTCAHELFNLFENEQKRIYRKSIISTKNS